MGQVAETVIDGLNVEKISAGLIVRLSAVPGMIALVAQRQIGLTRNPTVVDPLPQKQGVSLGVSSRRKIRSSRS